MDWIFWIFLHGLLAIVAAGIALARRRWWTATLILPGAVIGGVVAVVSIFKMMESNTAKTTGVGSGNLGIFFCCTVPLFPIVGMAVAWAIGLALDGPRAIPTQGSCMKCGYSLRGLKQRGACPECGEEFASNHPPARQERARIDRTDYEQ